jgi:transcriptional regulator with XRE-family HTH domain
MTSTARKGKRRSKRIDPTPLGQMIAGRRRGIGKSLETVAAEVNALDIYDDMGRKVTLSGAALSRIENGLRLPAVATMQGLAVILGVAFFIDGEGVTLMAREEEASTSS